jgi:hypothetical protein
MWEALKAKQKQLKQQGKGNKPKRACPLTDEETNILYNRNVLGSHTPQSLLNIPVAMIECPYFVRRNFLSTLLMIERKVHGSKSPPSFFLTVKRKLARS